MTHRLVIGAIDRKTNKITHPVDATREDKYSCPVCSEDVILKKGSVRFPHFAHKKLSNCCIFENQQNNQTHLIAQIQLKQLLESDSHVIVEQICERCLATTGESVLLNQTIIPKVDEGRSIQLEYPFLYEGHSRRADVAYIGADGQPLYIFEIYNTHKTDPLIRPEPWFEFDAKDVINLFNSEAISVSNGELRLRCIRSFVCDRCTDCLSRENEAASALSATLPKPKIYFNQRGAGCGKTYESVQLTNATDEFAHKRLFIYLTKTHSAKDTIYFEFRDQMDQGKLGNLQRMCEDDLHGKQYKMKYWNSLFKKELTVLIGTVDSMMHALADLTKLLAEDPDYFKNILHTINAGYMSLKNDKVYYAGASRSFSQEVLINIDESQDLSGKYIEAFDKILERTNSDVYLIGDKLQSIYGEENIYTYALDNLSTQCVRSEGVNKVRRFKRSGLMDFVNAIVPFQTYDLPPITEVDDNAQEDETIPYESFQMVDDLCSKENPCKLEPTIQDVMKRVNAEVIANDYLPHNFMFIFPFIKNNVFASVLHTTLQFYWAEKFEDVEYRERVLKDHEYWKDKTAKQCYTKTVVWHKAEKGEPIDLRKSEHATRILSIHASKGTGCEVVFVLGITESTLKRFSDQGINLVYESLLHVAITRQKKKIYFGVVLNNDNIHRRISRVCPIVKSENIPPELGHISKNIKVTDIADGILADSSLFLRLKTQVIDVLQLEQHIPIDPINNKHLIDFGHHIARRCIMDYYYTQHIETIDCHNALTTMHRNYFYFTTTEQKPNNKYLIHLKEIHKGNERTSNNTYNRVRENSVIPILSYADKENTIRQYFADWLERIIKTVCNKVPVGMHNERVPPMCLIECVVYSHIFNIMKEGICITSATIHEVYDIMNSLNNAFIVDTEHTEQFQCDCHLWVGHKRNNTQKVEADGDHQLLWFYSQVHHISGVFQKYLQKLNELNVTHLEYNKSHLVGVYDLIDVHDTLHTIGHNGTTVVYHLLEPTFNALNFNKVILTVLLTHFILCNQKQGIDAPTQRNNYTRYHGKTIYACIFTFSSTDPIFIPIDITPHLETIREILRTYLEIKYRSYNNSIYNFYQFFASKTGSMEDAVEEIRSTLANVRKRPPDYVETFFAKMEQSVEDEEEDKYDSQEKFEKKLNLDISKMLNRIYYLQGHLANKRKSLHLSG
jgi:hypothetical protein